jgi:hypothetical protein
LIVKYPITLGAAPPDFGLIGGERPGGLKARFGLNFLPFSVYLTP